MIDTDAANEIDDQFAITHAVLSPERLDIGAFYAAPFSRGRATGPSEGVRRAHAEIERVLDLVGTREIPVLTGSRSFMTESARPVPSEAAEDLVTRASARPEDSPLYVVAIGAATNVASALLLQPDIVRRVVVIWLGGHDLHLDPRAYNLEQDPHAARVLFDSGVPLIHVPCYYVTTHLTTTIPELRDHVGGRGKIGAYLYELAEERLGRGAGASAVLWDLACIAYLLDESWLPTDVLCSPVLTHDLKWERATSRHPIRNARVVHRDPVFKDLFSKLAQRS